jgi:hypothetical protein
MSALTLHNSLLAMTLTTLARHARFQNGDDATRHLDRTHLFSNGSELAQLPRRCPRTTRDVEHDVRVSRLRNCSA